HCFLVDWPATKPMYVTGFGVKADTPSIVHHVIAFLAPPQNVAEYQALDDSEPGPGYTCFGGPGGSGGFTGWLGGWPPGAAGADFPEGTGIEVQPGSKVITQVHYNTFSAPPSPDQSSVLLKIDPTVNKKAFVLPFLDPGWIKSGTMTIPAHATDA